MHKLIIVDDHPLFRTGVVQALKETMDLEVIAEAGTVNEALAMLEAEAFDLAIVDVGLPDRSGLEIVEALARKPGSPRFFVLSMETNRGSVRKALQLGASGYASKTIPLGSLVLALRLVLEGELFVERDILRDLLTATPREASNQPEVRSRFESLTPREREFLSAFLGGLTSKEIAGRLGVSQRTAENYQSSIYLKTGVNTPVDLVRLAQLSGMTLVPWRPPAAAPERRLSPCR